MSFDPSSYSNSDLMTSSYGDYSDMSGASNHQSSYSNQHLFMSSYGYYSDIAQVKHVPYDPFEHHRKTNNLLVWDEIKISDELEEPFSKLSSEPKYNNHLQNTLNNLNGNTKSVQPQPVRKSLSHDYTAPIQSRQFEQKSVKDAMNENIGGTKNTSVNPLVKSSVEHYLSKRERKSVKQINDPKLTALLNLGDREYEQKLYRESSLNHRRVQELLNSDKYKKNHTNRDVGSMNSYGKNSANIHLYDYAKYYYSIGYKFHDIFYPEKPLSQYKPYETINYKRTFEKEYDNDTKSVSFINSCCQNI